MPTELLAHPTIVHEIGIGKANELVAVSNTISHQCGFWLGRKLNIRPSCGCDALIMRDYIMFWSSHIFCVSKKLVSKC